METQSSSLLMRRENHDSGGVDGRPRKNARCFIKDATAIILVHTLVMTQIRGDNGLIVSSPHKNRSSVWLECARCGMCRSHLQIALRLCE